MCRSTSRQVDPEVWFRIVHVSGGGRHDGPVAAYREQTVEIALGGPRVRLKMATWTPLRLRAPPSRVVSSVPPGNPIPAKVPKTPRVVELLRKAIEWKDSLESGKVASQAEIARHEGVTRARVTQIMGLLRLAPDIQEKILTPLGTLHRRPLTERMLRPIEAISNQTDQLSQFERLLA